MTDEQGSIWKEAIVVCYTYNRKKSRKYFVTINGNEAETRTEYLPNANPERYQNTGERHEYCGSWTSVQSLWTDLLCSHEDTESHYVNAVSLHCPYEGKSGNIGLYLELQGCDVVTTSA